MKFPIRHAHDLSGIPNAFSPRPLSTPKELEEFYCDTTMPVRMGDQHDSPIQDIIDACTIPTESGNAFLLLGHKGCGKSTELNKMSEQLEKAGTPVCTIQCRIDVDMNPTYSDLLILMGEALLTIAGRTGCPVDPKIEATIRSFFTEAVEKTWSRERDAGAEIDVEASAGRSLLKLPLLKLLGKVKVDLKYNVETRELHREQVKRRLSVWMDAMNALAIQITDRLGGRQPVLIFEDLDKLDPEPAWNVFLDHTSTLAGPTFPVVYTFPIALSYDPRFKLLEGAFTAITFPMIKLSHRDDSRCEEGYEAIREIVHLRADPELFDPDALDDLIRRTGGDLRDLFAAINACSRRARRRGSERIEQEDADRALETLKSSLTRRIERRNYDFLAQIYGGDRENIEDKEMLLEMLRAGVVLEYNGRRWHNVHPLVAEFLQEQGVIGED